MLVQVRARNTANASSRSVLVKMRAHALMRGPASNALRETVRTAFDRTANPTRAAGGASSVDEASLLYIGGDIVHGGRSSTWLNSASRLRDSRAQPPRTGRVPNLNERIPHLDTGWQII